MTFHIIKYPDVKVCTRKKGVPPFLTVHKSDEKTISPKRMKLTRIGTLYDIGEMFTSLIRVSPIHSDFKM